MNMTSLPAPACPYCALPLRMWPRSAPVYHCHECQRPLGRYLWRRVPAIYRIFSLIAAAKILTALGGVAMIVALTAGRMTLEDMALAVAVQLVLYGGIEITDGVLGLGSGIDRTARSVRVGGYAKLCSWAKIAFGAVNCALAALGFLVLAWHGQ